MSCTIGRASLTTNPYNLSLNGKVLSFSIDLVGSTVGELTALRQQLTGYVDNHDEGTIPFTWTEDATLNGFYTDVNVTVPSTINMLNSFFVQSAQVSLTQVTGVANPRWETSLQSIVRTNTVAITVPPSVVVVSYLDALDTTLSLPPGLTGVGATALVAPDGFPSNQMTFGTLAAPVALTQYQFSGPPSLYYAGACLLEIKDGAGAWRKAVGRDIPSTALGSWRISNGIFRLTSSATTGASEATLLEVFLGGAWESLTIKTNLGNGIGYAHKATSAPLAVLANRPDLVSVRVFGTSQTETFTIQRGNYFVAWTLKQDTLLGSFGVKFGSVTACTAITGGLRATANDANGNRGIFASTGGTTNDLVNGSLTVTAAILEKTFLLGVEPDGSTAGTLRSAADIVNQFMGSVSSTQRIVV